MLRYICISDLHAGSLTSLLDDRPHPVGELSAVTQAFVPALDSLLEKAGNPKPQLILLGDVLDLQFSKRSAATTSAYGFLKALADTGRLAGDVIATAGNHDHALWTDARLSLHADTFSADPNAPDYREATPAFTQTPKAQSRLLSALLTSAGFDGCDLRYPNIGFANDDRAVLLHHGHFVETEYRLMTALRQSLLATGHTAPTIESLSAENAGWIDFAWSTFGDAAGLGHDTEMLYQNFLTSAGFRRLTKRWAEAAADKLADMLPMPGNVSMREKLGLLTRVGLDTTLGKFRDTERYAEVDALTTGGLAGLRWYLEGPTRRQIEDERKALPKDMTFVFGHTHKPFSSHVSASGYTSPVKVYNTGGWTLNGPRLDNAEGAAMVMIDENLNTVALRLFNTPRNGTVEPARVEVLSTDPDAKTFAGHVEDWMKQSPDVWQALARAAESAYIKRQQRLLTLTKGDPESSLIVGAAE